MQPLEKKSHQRVFMCMGVYIWNQPYKAWPGLDFKSKYITVTCFHGRSNRVVGTDQG